MCLTLGHILTLLLEKVLQTAAMVLQLTTQEFVAGEKMLQRGSSTQALFFPEENSYISICFHLSYLKHVSELLILSDVFFISNRLQQTHLIFHC